MHVLALDSSTKDVSIALSRISDREAHLVASLHLPLAPRTDADLPADYTLSCAIAELLVESDVKMKDIDLFSVGRAPGEGAWSAPALAFMRKLAAGAKKPLAEISSLEVMAAEAFAGKLPLGAIVVPILASPRSGSFYAGAYEAGAPPSDPPRAIVPDGERTIEALRAALLDAKKKRGRLMGPSLAMAPTWYGCGSGWYRASAALSDLLSPIDPTVLLPVFDPSLFELAQAAYRQHVGA